MLLPTLLYSGQEITSSSTLGFLFSKLPYIVHLLSCLCTTYLAHSTLFNDRNALYWAKSLTHLPGDISVSSRKQQCPPSPPTSSVISCCISLSRSSFIITRNTRNETRTPSQKCSTTLHPNPPNYKSAYTPDILLNFRLMASTKLLIIFRSCLT